MISDLTVENVLSYRSACEALALKLIELEEKGFRRTVIPSRGASPLMQGAELYFHRVWKPQHADNQISDLLKHHLTGPFVNPLYLPFTADLPLSDCGIESRDIKRFWVAVLAALLRSDFDDPYLRFYQYLRSDVCKLGFMHNCEQNGLEKQFVFVDTVVSGRAISEIMDAFDEQGITGHHLILLIDANGERLVSKYRQKLEIARACGKATLIYMKRLYTEDQGPAISGIWCVSMPELMAIGRELVPAFRKSNAIGAGLYYHEVRARDDNSNLQTTKAIGLSEMLMFCAIDFQNNHLVDERGLQLAIDRLKKQLADHNLLNRMATVQTAEPKVIEASTTEVALTASSSHALRVNLNQDDARRLIRAFTAR